MLRKPNDMKTRFFQSYSLGLALSVLPFVAGCSQKSGDTPQSLLSAASAEPVVQATNTDPVSTNDLMAAPAPPAEKKLPPNIKPSTPLAEIIKLANAGVDESVMLTFVNSSQGLFSLGSDEIIYLNDLGVPDEVVTAMIERDQVLKQPWAPPTQTQPATTEVANTAAEESQEQPVAAAPTYVNPPQPAPVEQPQQIVNDNYFYDNLAPYGSWMQVDGYGWCWQPTVVSLNRGWQPYCDRGRWVNTDCGWYWQSDYSWGTTFHYGRWFNHPSRGWCWWPDRVWGPSWVTWRYNNDYCGWAPLPPRAYYRSGIGLTYFNGSVGLGFNFGLNAGCYTFVSWRGFCDPHPYRHRLPASHVTTVYNNSTIINNFAARGDGKIVNRGIAPDRVSQITRRPIHSVPVREAQTRIAANRWADRDNDGLRTPADRRSRGPEENSGRPVPNGNARGGNQTPGSRRASVADATPAPQQQTPAAAPSSPVPRHNEDSGIARDNGSPRNNRQGDRGDTAPVNARGSDNPNRPTQTTPARNTTPRGSLIVIGRRDGNESRIQNRFTPPSTPNTYAANQNSSPQADTPQPVHAAPQVRNPAPNQTRTWSAPAQNERQENPRPVQRVGNRIENRPSQAVNVQRSFAPSTPTYTPPVVNQRSAPPRYNPVPAPAPRTPQYNPAPAPTPRAPTIQSQPAPSPRVQQAPQQSSGSSGSNRSRDDRNDRNGRRN